jgi:hypothetical protein
MRHGGPASVQPEQGARPGLVQAPTLQRRPLQSGDWSHLGAPQELRAQGGRLLLRLCTQTTLLLLLLPSMPLLQWPPSEMRCLQRAERRLRQRTMGRPIDRGKHSAD